MLTVERVAREVAARARRAPAHCTVCGRLWPMWVGPGSLRETVVCGCGAYSRQRQMATAILSLWPAPSLRALAQRHPELRVCNTEANGAVHRELAALPHYTCSEYLGPQHAPGTTVDGVRHEDVSRLSHADSSFDLFLTSDVLEHVPDPYAAHDEIRRVLRVGGHHVFTVPFDAQRPDDLQRARLRADGGVEHLAEPEYHGDPVRPEGVLAFTTFGAAMPEHIAERGFEVRTHWLRSRMHGILGGPWPVFVATRVR